MIGILGGTSTFVIFDPQSDGGPITPYVRFAGEGPQLFWPIQAVRVPTGAQVTVYCPSGAVPGTYGIWVSIPDFPPHPGSVIYAIDLDVGAGVCACTSGPCPTRCQL